MLKAARAVTDGPGDRRGPAAPLLAPARPVRRVLPLLQRRRRGDRGRRLCRPARRRSRASTATPWSRACAATATAACWRWTSPADLAGAGAPRRPSPATWWSAGRRRHHRLGLRPAGPADGAGAGRRMSWRDAPAGGRAASCCATSRSAPSPGCGSAARPTCCSCRPDEDDLADVPAQASTPDVPVTVLGVGSNIIVRDGGVEGVVIRLAGRAFADIESSAERHRISPARRRWTRPWRARRPRPGSPGWSSIAGIPGLDRRRADA